MRKMLALLLSIIYIALTGLSSWHILHYMGMSTNFKIIIVVLFLVITIISFIRFWATQLKKARKSMTMKQKRTIKRKRAVSICLMLVFCIIIAYGNYAYIKIDDTLTEITNVDLEEESLTCYVYALKDSPNTTLKSQGLQTMGVLSREDGAIKLPLTNSFKKDFQRSDVELESYPTLVDLYIGLMEEYVEMIIVSKNEDANLKSYNKDFEKNTKLVTELTFVSSSTSDPVNVTKEAFNVLILGVDIREEEGTIKTDSRTDTIMVASFNPVTMKVSLISIPRDSYVQVSNGDYDKITHAGMSGLPTVINTVENLLGININYYAKFNFNALVEVIDAIGGINIHVDYSFCEQDSQDVPDAICVEEGQQQMDGEEALAYARHRKTVSDHIRNNAQQQVIQGITNKLMSVAVLTNFNSLLKVLSSNAITNFSKKELYDLAGLAPSLGSLQYHNAVISGEDDLIYIPKYDSDMSVTYLDETSLKDVKALIQQIHSGQ